MEIVSGFTNQNKNSIVSRLTVGVALICQESIYHVLVIKRLSHKLYLTDLEAFDSLLPLPRPSPDGTKPPFDFSGPPPSSSFYTWFYLFF